MSSITGIKTGGLPILSYRLDWNSGGSGSTYTTLIGDPTDSLVTSQTLTSLTTGTMYKFRYSIRNDIGWSLYSDELITYSAIAPAQMSAPTTSIDSLTVKIQWVDPDNGGMPITAYQILIQSKNGIYLSEPTQCLGSDATILSNKYCNILLTTLTAIPFSLLEGDLVKVEVASINAIGTGLLSNANTAGALIEVVPAKPPVPPIRDALTTQSSITVDYTVLTGFATGGTPILTYSLEWDAGTNGVTWTVLIGDSPYSLLITYTISSGINPGSTYKFRYRAMNR